TRWMKSQREPSAGKEVMKGHGWDMCLYLMQLHGIVLNFYREVLKEDESGSLKATVEEILYQSKRKSCLCFFCLDFTSLLCLPHRVTQSHAQVRLGMMRHLYVVIDCSRSMEDQDLKPNRLTSTLKLMEGFIDEYFDQNPISQMLHCCIFSPVCCQGQWVNIMGNTADWTDVQNRVTDTLHKEGMPQNIIAEEYSCSLATVSSFVCAFFALLILTGTHVCLGFPQHSVASLSDQDVKPSFSMSHLDYSGGPALTLGGYFCPQCQAKYTELPVECKVCGLTLVSAPHLARSFHHLFPLQAFIEHPADNYHLNRSSPVLCVAVCSVGSVISSSMNHCTAVPAAFTIGLLHEAQSQFGALGKTLYKGEWGGLGVLY
ncbi:hypothetical protein CCH79_00019370, partial [Gambusia affinis]